MIESHSTYSPLKKYLNTSMHTLKHMLRTKVRGNRVVESIQKNHQRRALIYMHWKDYSQHMPMQAGEQVRSFK